MLTLWRRAACADEDKKASGDARVPEALPFLAAEPAIYVYQLHTDGASSEELEGERRCVCSMSVVPCVWSGGPQVPVIRTVRCVART